MDEVERIAKGLNSDQQWLIEQLPVSGERRTWEAGLPSMRLKGLRGFAHSDLIDAVHDHAGAHIGLSSLGLKVRAHLIAQAKP